MGSTTNLTNLLKRLFFTAIILLIGCQAEPELITDDSAEGAQAPAIAQEAEIGTASPIETPASETPTAPLSEDQIEWRPDCTLPDLALPAETMVFAAGGYNGRPIDYQIDQSGHVATQFDVKVTNKQPVVLILGAYEPTIWNISWLEGSEIAAVLVSGYHRQAISGLPNDVPRLISTFVDAGPCGSFFVEQGRDTLINPLSEALFGQPLDQIVAGDESGELIIGPTLPQNAQLVFSSDTRPEDFYILDAPLAGQAGLNAALEQGLIRQATFADLEQWIEKSPFEDEGAVEMIQFDLDLGSAYVVMEPFQFPVGLTGANSAVFFIAEGAPFPMGDPGHSTLLDFNTLDCLGIICE